MKKMRKENTVRINSIQTKLVFTMVLTLSIVLGINLYIFKQMNTMVQDIDSVFASNVTIADLKEKLEHVQNYVYEYLNTKSTSALEDYYRYEQDYRTLVGQLNEKNVDNSLKILEKNIRNMSETFLSKTAKTVQAKRGRNVESYKALYEEETELYGYINAFINEWNNQQFQQNSRNYQMLLSSMNILELCCIIVFAVAFVISIFVIIMTTKAMIKPLRQLAAAAHCVAEGDFEVEIPRDFSEDEIGVVASAFGQMVKSIKKYIEDIRNSLAKEAQMKERELLMEARLNEAQLKYLRAQMNPHFLFNSLNAGIQLAMMEDAEQTGIFLEKMADFFRYDVKKMGTITTLLEEIQAVDNYIYILNVRFSGDIIYEKQIEEDEGLLKNIQMPSMILQPIVENAVQHGIREILGEGVVRLSVKKREDRVCITVSDNGIGMTRERIAEVMRGEAQPEQEDNSSNGIALDNVIHRLKLYYNDEDLLHIHSEGSGCGTEVTLFLPLYEGERLYV